MKEILIDIYKAKDLYSGLGQFAVNFAEEIIASAAIDLKFNFLTYGNFNKENASDIKFIKADFQKRYFPGSTKHYDIWHSLHQFPSHFPNKSSKYILTVHDLNFLIEKNKLKASMYLKRLQKNIDRADAITAISDYTKKLIEENINLKGKSVCTIYNGVKLESFSNFSKHTFMGSKKFFFAISVFKEKKNFHVLLPMMKHLEDFQLIIAGNNDTSYGEQIKRKIRQLGLKDRVILTGTISEQDKLWLYLNCEAFLVPSLAEGFGLPVIEAMMCGKPVFLSKETCLPEIGGDVAFYFDNFEEKYMSDLIKEKLTYYRNNYAAVSTKIKQHADKFTWKASIDQYLNLYRSL